MITLSSTFSPATTSRVCSLSLSSSSSSKHFAVTVRLAGPPRNRRLVCPCFSAMAEVVKDKEASPSSSVASAAARKEEEEEEELKRSRSFFDAKTEEELLLGIREGKDAGRIPPNVASGMEELYQNYKNAIFQSGTPKAEEIVVTNMAAALDRIFVEVEDPFVFLPHHKALREPFDYYTFGQQYIRPLIDFRNSYVGNISIFSDMEKQLKEGHNIVLISNHQTEADPAVIALSLESTNPYLAENLTYIAGDRVLTDPLCKPFSMGRNLLCVYSKKHMADDPELIDMKRRANTRSLKELALLLRGGSQFVWIAPSGGRDRPDPVTEEWFPWSFNLTGTFHQKGEPPYILAPFDTSSVDNMRRLVEYSSAPGHIYPLALLCHDIMPPPQKVEKEIGEKRIISFHGTGLSVAPAISFSNVAASTELSEEKAREAYAEMLYGSVNDQYNVLKSAIHGNQGLKASSSTVSLSQPWN